MSCSFVVRAQVGGRDLEKKRRNPNIHYSTYYVCLTFFFSASAVLAAAFVRCKVRSPHIQYLSLSLVHTYYIHITFKTNDPPPDKEHVNLGSVGHNAMQPVHNMCLSDFPSDYNTNSST